MRMCMYIYIYIYIYITPASCVRLTHNAVCVRLRVLCVRLMQRESGDPRARLAQILIFEGWSSLGQNGSPSVSRPGDSYCMNSHQCTCVNWAYAQVSNEDPAKSGLESKRILNVEGGCSYCTVSLLSAAFS